MRNVENFMHISKWKWLFKFEQIMKYFQSELVRGWITYAHVVQTHTWLNETSILRQTWTKLEKAFCHRAGPDVA